MLVLSLKFKVSGIKLMYGSLYFSSMLLGLMYDLLRGSSACQQQLIQCQGFMVIGHLLQKSSAVHLTEATVDILLGLARYCNILILNSTPTAS